MTTSTTISASEESSSGCWSFGAWQLFEADQRLRAGEAEPVDLDRSAYGVLRYLLLHSGEVCTTEELLSAGWPERVVSTNSVAKCISRLRRTLGDAQAELIRLVHGYGYRLTGEVRYQPGGAGSSPGELRLDLQPGESVPHRPGWRLQARLGRGSCGEVFSALGEAGLESRAYKFALGEDGLRALKREVVLHRLLQDGPKPPDCVLPLLDWNLEAPPFFVATPYMWAGNLATWAEHDSRLNRSTRTERLEWCAQLCEAVELLHATDIAHRDLKPENIYPVETAGGGRRFLLGDLGAGAGLLPPGIDALGLPIGQATQVGHADSQDPASPGHRYVAPEVLAGHAAGQRADVFALGVLCAQLLAGDLRMSLAPGWEERIGDPLLCADLAEAAHIDPKRRLGSAGELAERLRSLEARREAAAQRQREAEELTQSKARVQRLRRRWRVTSAIAGTAVLALSISVWMGLRAETAQREAERNAERAVALRHFLSRELLSQADPYSVAQSDNGNPRLVEAMQRAAERIDQVFANDNEAAAYVHMAMSGVFDSWTDYRRAMQHSRRAIDLLAPAQTTRPLELAEAGLLLCAQGRMAGDLSASQVGCDSALKAESEALGAARLKTRVEAAKLEFELGHCQQAIAELSDALARAGHEITEDWYSEALWFRGLCHAQLAHFTEARADFEALLQWRERANDLPLDRAWTHSDYAETLTIEGDFEAALEHIEKSAPVFESIFGPEHHYSKFGDFLRARIAFWSGDAASAVALFEGVYQAELRDLGREHLWTLQTLAELLWAKAAAGLIDEVQPIFIAERDRSLQALGDRLQQRSALAEIWARTALLLGDLDTAEAEIERAQQDTQASLPATHPRHALVQCLRGELALARGEVLIAREQAARCAEKLSGLPEDNYRRRWAADLRARIEA
ncbi:protein kinase domain-containing protein [Aquimonas voraii]|uniref:Transcriptional regulatory protein, C terminal n=1 Tax=Aquimonas voraii TaxID=265719 RepID=A0A1G6RUM7_9GAMM|nr:winged helix-turn-helix domain-containing protein [Aquimonas voraii]SDD07645.1 Transcriptional regulatory protein, C terminal [Aquimonas voraii]